MKQNLNISREISQDLDIPISSVAPMNDLSKQDSLQFLKTVNPELFGDIGVRKSRSLGKLKKPRKKSVKIRARKISRK